MAVADMQESSVSERFPYDMESMQGRERGKVWKGFGRTGELGETVLVRRPRSAQEGLVVVRPRVLAQQALTGSLGRGTFPLEDRVLVRVASVVAGRVGVPQVDEHVRHRLASVDVDDADIHELPGSCCVSSAINLLQGQKGQKDARRGSRAGPRPCFDGSGDPRCGSTGPR